MHQNHVEKHDDKLDHRKEQFSEVEDDRESIIFDLDEVIKMDEDADTRFDIATTAKAQSEPQTRLNSSSKNDATSNEARKINQEVNLTHDNALPAKKCPDSQAELNSSEKDETSDGMRKVDEGANSITELNSSENDAKSTMEAQDNMKENHIAFEQDAMFLLSECKKRIHELEDELDKSKASEANLYEALVMQTKQLDLNKLLFEESMLEIASLKEKVVKSQAEEAEGFNKLDPMKAKPLLQKMSFLRNEIESAFEGEDRDNVAKNLLEELKYLKNELKFAMKAEENSKTAMDDLVLALKEVAEECRQTKEKLAVSQVELLHSTEEAEHLKALLNRTEETYKKLIGEAKKESERNYNTSERLRLEAEDSLLAWNEKTKEFVNCIRRSEEERTSAQEECKRLQEMVTETENKIRVSKEENQKLRDILKQALNEANVAKEAAGIAQSENSQLKDMLGMKEETVKMLTQENEMLKIHEAAAFENIKELKRLLAEAPIKELKNHEEKVKEKSSAKETSKAKEHKEVKSLSKAISLNLKEIISPHKQLPHKEGDEDPIRETDDDDLKGSIFDELDGDMVISDHYEIDESQDEENNSRKRKALLRRFGALIRRKGTHTHKKGHSISNDESLNSLTPPTHHNQSSF